MVGCNHHGNVIFWDISKCLDPNDFLWQFFLFDYEDYHFMEFHILKRVNNIVFWNQIWSVFQAVLYLEIYLVLQMSWVCHWNWTFPSKSDTVSWEARIGGLMLLRRAICILSSTVKPVWAKELIQFFFFGLPLTSHLNIGCAMQFIGFLFGHCLE
jgi:hypothetical protein